MHSCTLDSVASSFKVCLVALHCFKSVSILLLYFEWCIVYSILFLCLYLCLSVALVSGSTYTDSSGLDLSLQRDVVYSYVFYGSDSSFLTGICNGWGVHATL